MPPALRHLTSVNGELTRVAPDDVPATAPVRVAEDVTADEGQLLARAVTVTHAFYESRLAGAAITIRPRLLDTHAETMARVLDELSSDRANGLALLADLGCRPTEVVTDDGPSPGTGLRPLGDDETARVLGLGWVAAVTAVRGDLDGQTVAVEGFGAAGVAVARAARAAGARVVAVSTERGAIADGRGLDVEALVAARDAHGPRFVHEVGMDVHLPAELHALAVDILAPGARTGGIDGTAAERVQAPVVAPFAWAPYTADALRVLHRHGVIALPDAAGAAGPIVAATAPPGLTASEIDQRVAREIGRRMDDALRAKVPPVEYTATLASTFASTWLPADAVPADPVLPPR